MEFVKIISLLEISGSRRNAIFKLPTDLGLSLMIVSELLQTLV